MLNTVFTVIHIVVSLALILIVLLQTGKGADMGAAFGGGSSQTLFGSSGASTFLSRLTTWAAIIFMITSMGLVLHNRPRQQSTVLESKAPIEQPAQPVATPAPAATDKTE